MTPSATAQRTLGPTRDPRLGAYLVAVSGATLLALVSGRPEPAAAAAPFLVALLVGLRHAGPQPATIEVSIERAQVVEGDVVVVGIVVDRPRWMRVDCRVSAGEGFALPPPRDPPTETGPVWVRAAGDRARHEVHLVATRWGRHVAGSVVVEGRRTFGLLRWVTEPVDLPAVRVLPTAERLRALLAPAASHASSGSHLARRRVSTGSEFAEIRPYQTGDRLRDLNWAASARRQSLHVNRHHPEVSGDVVVMIDTSFDAIGTASPAGQEALVRCARAAWAIANVHLGAQDRVGLLAAGTVTRWLQPAGGTRARYELLETLLDIGAVLGRRGSDWSRAPEERVPPAALVVGLTPMWDDRFAVGLVNLARRGRHVVALVVDAADLLPAPANSAEQVARNVFTLAFEDRLARLRHAGVPAVVWHPDSGIDPAITTLARRRAPASVGAR